MTDTTLLPTTNKGWLSYEPFTNALARSLPRHVGAKRFVQIALTAYANVPRLRECTADSFLKCLLRLAQLGLDPDGQQAALIPRKNKKARTTECTLIVGYQGLVELANRSGVVAFCHAREICQRDVFRDVTGVITHEIKWDKPRGKVWGVWARCVFKNGSQIVDVMTKAEVEAVRKRSQAGNDGPWVTDWNEMAKKTVFRRLAKWIPKSAELRSLRETLDADHETPGLEVETEVADMLGAKAAHESEPTQVTSDSAGEESQEPPADMYDDEPGANR